MSHDGFVTLIDIVLHVNYPLDTPATPDNTDWMVFDRSDVHILFNIILL